MAMIKIKFKNVKLDQDFENIFDFEFSILLRIIKMCSGAEFSYATKIWSIDFSLHNLQLLTKYMNKARHQYLLGIINKSKELKGYDFLLPFQKIGVEGLIDGKKLLCDDVGLGKTLQTLAYADAIKAQKVLIVCPAPLKRQWQQEIEKYFHFDAYSLDGTPQKRLEGLREYERTHLEKKWIIINYEQLALPSNDFLYTTKWDLVIFDEIHRLKNHKTQTHRLAKKLIALNKIGATATPFVNTPMELFTIVNFLSKNFFSYVSFLQNYCITSEIPVFNSKTGNYEKKSIITAYKNLGELNKRLSSIMIRRKKDEVLPELPKRTYQNYYIKLPKYQQDLHDEMYDLAETAFEREDQGNLLGYLNLARISCNSTKQVKESESQLKPVVTEEVSGKIQLLKEILPQFDEKIIIFSQWEKTVFEIANNLGTENCEIITGSTTDKMASITDFRTNNKKYLVVTDCLNYGINLEFVRVLIHADLPWSPAKIEQREGRIDRLTQKSKMLIIKLIAENTVEEKVVKLLEQKKHMFNTAVDSADVVTSKAIISDLFRKK